ncbi:hypothetical protein D9M69_568440 [compost metagenome]
MNCRENVCNHQTTKQFAGEGGNDNYSVRNGYYLGYGEDGRTYAYRGGTGPGFGGAAYAGSGNTAQPVSSSGEACYEKKMADFRQENGDEAMIIHDQIVEWKEACGLPASE